MGSSPYQCCHCVLCCSLVIGMGNVSLFVVFLSIIFSHNISRFCGYALNQGNIYGAFLGDEVGQNSTCLDGSLFKITNKSCVVQQSYDRDATQLDTGAIVTFLAGHAMDSQNYYGVEVTSDVYGFPINEQEAESGIIVHVSSGKGSSRNAIDVGWHVNPGLYGDFKTHFYVHWTGTGCFNLDCPGYVPDEGTVRPGATIDAVSDPNGVKRTIIFKLFKDSTGDWLLHIGFDSEPYLLGRFPKNLFTTLGDKADTIALSGYVVTHTTNLIPMGSGFLSENAKAASFSNIQIIDQNGQASKITQDQPAIVEDKKLYSVSPINAEGMFTYGGPAQ
ncbi:hypothetical protein ACP4OV_019608 [Aristida adscensionis]